MFSLFLARDPFVDLFLSNPKEEMDFLFLAELTFSSFNSLLFERRPINGDLLG